MSRSSRKVCRQRVQLQAMFEPMEPRLLYSRSIVDSAVDLGSFALKSHAVTAGSVGLTNSDSVYKVAVTAPVNLNVALTALKQNDTVHFLFADGKVIPNTGGSSGSAKSMKFVQLLNAGTYYIDVNHGTVAGFGAAKVKKYHYKNTNGFKLAVKGLKADPNGTAPAEAVSSTGFGAAFGAGTGLGEPTISSTLAQQSGYSTYKDFSAEPIWGASGPSPDDIVQGGVGDCYFLAALSDIARNDPGLIEQDVVLQANGGYLVKFQANGQERDEQIDTTLPVNTSGNLVFNHLGASNALWPAIMEKAFCFFRQSTQPNSYDGIESGLSNEVFADFGSTDSDAIDQSQYVTANAMMQQISTDLNGGRLVTFGTVENPVNGMVGGHMYSVVSVTGDGNLYLRNPWGTDSNGNAGTGGYITLSPDEARQSLGAICSATVPAVNVNPDPTPPPAPAPTPAQDNIYQGTLGSNSYVSNDGQYVDAYTFTATTAGDSVAGGLATSFTPEIEVAEVDSSGNLTVIGYDGNAAGSEYSYVQFTAVAGQEYAVLVTSSSASVTGSYELSLSSNLGAPTQFGPNGLGNGGGGTTTTTLGSMSGIVFEDDNADGVQDGGETGSQGWLVYIDTNNVGSYQDGDAYTYTDANGNYTFTDLESGSYIVRIQPDSSWYQTSPSVGYGWNVPVSEGEDVTVNPFAEYYTG